MGEAEIRDENLNMDCSGFNAEAYLSKLVREQSLKSVMDRECEVIKQSQFLHSEMQTLVYENYNKFISATDTVRKMRTDFKTMQTEMEQLSENMERITKFSEQISDSLEDSRNTVARLCGTRQLLTRLQFLFLLPSQLNHFISEGMFSEAVNEYLHAQRVLERYGSQPSFQGIQTECQEIVAEMVTRLKQRLTSHTTSAAQLAESVCLLVRLQGSQEALNEKFLCSSEPRLLNHLDNLKDNSNCADLLEWVEKGNTGLLADLGIVVTSYSEMFLQTEIHEDNVRLLNNFTDNIMNMYLELAKSQFQTNIEQQSGTEILVRGLDKFYRIIQAMNHHTQGNDYTNEATDIVMSVISSKGKFHFESIKGQFWERLISIRQGLASKTTTDLKEMLSSLQVFIIERVQASIQDLLVFLQSGLSFSFKPVCVMSVVDTCTDFIRQSITDMVATVKSFTTSQSANNTPAQLLVILSKLCYDLQSSRIHGILTQAEASLDKASYLGETVKFVDTLESSLCKQMGDGAQVLLDCYVSRIGLQVSQMLRVSVLSREWVRVLEPRGIRAVARRVMEALGAAELDAQQLYDSGGPTRQSSDSSRRTHSITASRLPYRSNWSNGVLDSSVASNINKLFSEKIEIFSPVEPNKISIMSGIVKISLKTFLECVRLRTYSRYGLQQMQVDIHYLQLHLWRFVQDENLVHILLDEVLGSVINRCVDPQLMEPSVVDIICERG